MDIKELEKNLKTFFDKCKDKGYPLDNHCLVENDIEFILEVKASWIDNLDSCSEALDILTAILWETTSAEIRKKIFAISILDSHEEPHCYTEITAE